ncbi:hypothetical protein K1Y77_08245 [Halomonas qaidamensis]|uniref:Uncharacterized protein n=1 Tax=Halomonas qaidamensis TaxID=2866211 RepID=A0ABY6JUL7_9GAMM|nr:hypothetical protein [Halomonas qaidamensis]UYV20621.1 hypothetical protein K1Y77_08245 [Halomonas qaidamensis]
MKNRNVFPSEILYDCVDTLRYLIAQDRKAFLYALAFLRGEPDWVRHAVQVTGLLTDLLLLRDPHDPQLREAMLGVMLHTAGKPLLVSEALPSLNVNMNPVQKLMLSGHVEELIKKLNTLG